MDTPKYKHSCAGCEFLGSYQPRNIAYDLYIHRSGEANYPFIHKPLMLVVRYTDYDGDGEYPQETHGDADRATQYLGLTPTPPLAEAWLRAFDRPSSPESAKLQANQQRYQAVRDFLSWLMDKDNSNFDQRRGAVEIAYISRLGDVYDWTFQDLEYTPEQLALLFIGVNPDALAAERREVPQAAP